MADHSSSSIPAGEYLDQIAEAKRVEIIVPGAWAEHLVVTRPDDVADYCRMHARKTHAEAMCREHGDIVAGPNGFPVESPWLKIVNACRIGMQRISASAPEAASVPPPGPSHVNKREMARLLGVSLPTFTDWVDRYNLPVQERGTNGREWQFDAEAVTDALRDRKEAEKAAGEERDQALAQLALPLDPAGQWGPGNISIRDQLDAQKLRRLMREDALQEGRLVEVAALKDSLGSALIAWNRSLHAALRQAARDHNLPDGVLRALQGRLGETQRAFVRDIGAVGQVDEADAA